MTRLGLPTFQGKVSYRYHNRDERYEIQHVLGHLRYGHPDITSCTIFSSPSEGVASVDVHEMVPAPNLGLLEDENTPKIQAAMAWIDQVLGNMGIHKLEPKKKQCLTGETQADFGEKSQLIQPTNIDENRDKSGSPSGHGGETPNVASRAQTPVFSLRRESNQAEPVDEKALPVRHKQEQNQHGKKLSVTHRHDCADERDWPHQDFRKSSSPPTRVNAFA